MTKEDSEEGLGSDGDLVLCIICTKCLSQFQLSRESVAMAIATKCKFVEYLRYVQISKCPKCNQEKDENT